MPEGQIQIEKRKHKRVEKRLSVSFKVVSMPAEVARIKQAVDKNSGDTVNISLGGVQLISEAGLVPEQIIRLELYTDKSGSVVTFAETRWSNKEEKTGKYRTGIEFLVLKDEDKKVIEEIIG
ncbi:MAG: PilZ domain-containing protein [Spirochaetia bacterium]|nr:PilZ domain-containing protein [Spirochaetia bacterium]